MERRTDAGQDYPAGDLWTWASATCGGPARRWTTPSLGPYDVKTTANPVLVINHMTATPIQGAQRVNRLLVSGSRC